MPQTSILVLWSLGSFLMCANLFSPHQFLGIIQELKLFRDDSQTAVYAQLCYLGG